MVCKPLTFPPQSTADFMEVDPIVRNFVEADQGDGPIYIGFGSMPVHLADSFLALIADLVRIAPENTRFIVLVESSISATDLKVKEDMHAKFKSMADGRVLPIKWVSHSWLFPRCRAIVHHGGAGTCARSIISRKTLVICPLLADQPFWSLLLAKKHKCIPPPVPLSKISGRKLWRQLEQSMSSIKYKTNMDALATKIEAENGLKGATDFLISHVQT